MHDNAVSFVPSSVAELSQQFWDEDLDHPSPRRIAPLQVLTSRDRYQCCHICCSIAEKDDFVPGILFEGQYYSLLRTEHVTHEAFKVARHMLQLGHSLTLTKIPKGYAIWILEPDAVPSPALRPKRKTPASSRLPQTAIKQVADPSVVAKPLSPSTTGLPYKILTSEDQYQLFYLHLPQAAGQTVAVRINDTYYKAFQIVKTIRQAARTAKLLAHYGQRSIITKMPEGYGVWKLDKTIQLPTNIPSPTQK